LAGPKHDGHDHDYSCLGNVLLPSWMGSAGNCTLLVLRPRRRESVQAQGRDGGGKDQIDPNIAISIFLRVWPFCCLLPISLSIYSSCMRLSSLLKSLSIPHIDPLLSSLYFRPSTSTSALSRLLRSTLSLRSSMSTENMAASNGSSRA